MSGIAILKEIPKLQATMHLFMSKQTPTNISFVKEDWLPIANPSKNPSKHKANNNK